MDTIGYRIDGLKFAGGSFLLMPEKSVTELIDIAHENDVYVSMVVIMLHLLSNGSSRYRANFMEDVLMHADVLHIAEHLCKDERRS